MRFRVKRTSCHTISLFTVSKGISSICLVSFVCFSMNLLKPAPGTQLGMYLKKGKNSTQKLPGTWAWLMPDMTSPDIRIYSWSIVVTFAPKTILRIIAEFKLAKRTIEHRHKYNDKTRVIWSSYRLTDECGRSTCLDCQGCVGGRCDALLTGLVDNRILRSGWRIDERFVVRHAILVYNPWNRSSID